MILESEEGVVHYIDDDFILLSYCRFIDLHSAAFINHGYGGIRRAIHL